SRREVSGSGTVRVTRQRFYAQLEPRHLILHPKDKVVVVARTLDANSDPLSAEGAVSISRDRWWEIWIDPHGKELAGPALEEARRKPGFDAKGWGVKFRGYQHDE